NLGELEFTVSDNGPGIKEQDLAHVADRYYRGSHDSDESISGNGLGLAIVQQAAIRHGGLLDIESTVGQGSRVKVIFPSFRSVARQRPIANVINLADY
ncbi:MAG: signal transduction histidine kinase, partial [Gammaproteobacteria bacterium]